MEPKLFLTEGEDSPYKHGEHTLISYRLESMEEILSDPNVDTIAMASDKTMTKAQCVERLEYFYNSKRENAELDFNILWLFQLPGGEEACHLVIFEAFDKILGLSEEEFQKEKEKDKERSLVEERAEALRQMVATFIKPLVNRAMEEHKKKQQEEEEGEDFNAFDTTT